MKKPTLLFAALLLLAATGAAQIPAAFFDQTDALWADHVRDGRIDYAALRTDARLDALVGQLANVSPATDASVDKAFRINAYNLLVAKAIADAYPVTSVQEMGGFFDRKKYTVAGEALTLNALEKRLLTATADPRLHFALVCGAVDCPPIIAEAYRPSRLDEQLERQTKLALNNPNFVRTGPDRIELSQLFNWYAADFGGRDAVRAYIDRHRTRPLGDTPHTFYTYNWALNDTAADGADLGVGNSAARYVVSAAIAKGTAEVKWFNNVYSQQTGEGELLTERNTFFTSTLSALYGVNNVFNAGLEIRYRRTSTETNPSTPFGVFASSAPGSRTGITGIGPKIRYAPFPEQLPNFSIQSTLTFATGDDLTGGQTGQPFIDWDGVFFNNQFFNDFTLSDRFSLFTEVDLLFENVATGIEGQQGRFSTPATVILSYFPDPKVTLYTLANFAPIWTPDLDYFAQAGLGTKYQFTPRLELELLATTFTNSFLQDTGGRALTLNVGIRKNF